MQFDYSKLLGRMKELGVTQETLAKHIGVSKSSMCLKLNNKANFVNPEVYLICEALKIPSNEIGVYFFTPKVRSVE